MTETLTKLRHEKYLLFHLRPTRESLTHAFAVEGLQNLGLYSALRAFEQGDR
jgi:hypothetical protein